MIIYNLGRIISLQIFTFDLKQCSAAAVKDMNYKYDLFDYIMETNILLPSLLNMFFLKVT
ncbi:MAG: hypothetical protein COA93_05955 [Alphaproteobacteria bacterium]|nr:MAG: hypothetical protein COA93_05955 [Alphaproteobacteria bacterium]